MPVVVTIALLIFSGPFVAAGTFVPHIISALCAGFYIAIYDWIIEAYAHEKGLWFCYGGYQKVKGIDFKHVPIDMVIGFVGVGFIVAFVTYVPELLRSWGWDFWPINNPELDVWLVPGFLVLFSLAAAFVDFRSKRSGVWMNGPTWYYWKCAFYAWLPMMATGIVVDRLVFLTWANPLLLSIAIIIPFLIETIVVIWLVKRVL